MRTTAKSNTSFTPSRKLVLRVRHCMANRGIRTVAALHRMLIDIGCQISHPQLIRVIDNKADRLNVNVLNGLLAVLQCGVDELFGIETAAT
jgi:hypothetical protein